MSTGKGEEGRAPRLPAAPSGAAVPCRLQSHSAGARHTPPLGWKNVLSSVPGTGSTASRPTTPELCPPVPGLGERSSAHVPPGRPTPGSHGPSRPAGRTHSTFPPPVQLPSRALTLPRVSRTRQVHKPQLSLHFSRLPFGCHGHQEISAGPDRDQTSDTEEHQRCFSSNTFLVGQGRLSWAPSEARAALGSELGVERSTC